VLRKAKDVVSLGGNPCSEFVGQAWESDRCLLCASSAHHAGPDSLHKPVCRDGDDAVKLPEVAEDFFHV
jgi:hypothetical protein